MNASLNDTLGRRRQQQSKGVPAQCYAKTVRELVQAGKRRAARELGWSRMTTQRPARSGQRDSPAWINFAGRGAQSGRGGALPTARGPSVCPGGQPEPADPQSAHPLYKTVSAARCAAN